MSQYLITETDIESANCCVVLYSKQHFNGKIEQWDSSETILSPFIEVVNALHEGQKQTRLLLEQKQEQFKQRHEELKQKQEELKQRHEDLKQKQEEQQKKSYEDYKELEESLTRNEEALKKFQEQLLGSGKLYFLKKLNL